MLTKVQFIDEVFLLKNVNYWNDVKIHTNVM